MKKSVESRNQLVSTELVATERIDTTTVSPDIYMSEIQATTKEQDTTDEPLIIMLQLGLSVPWYALVSNNSNAYLYCDCLVCDSVLSQLSCVCSFRCSASKGT